MVTKWYIEFLPQLEHSHGNNLLGEVAQEPILWKVSLFSRDRLRSPEIHSLGNLPSSYIGLRWILPLGQVPATSPTCLCCGHFRLSYKPASNVYLDEGM